MKALAMRKDFLALLRVNSLILLFHARVQSSISFHVVPFNSFLKLDSLYGKDYKRLRFNGDMDTCATQRKATPKRQCLRIKISCM